MPTSRVRVHAVTGCGMHMVVVRGRDGNGISGDFVSPRDADAVDDVDGLGRGGRIE